MNNVATDQQLVELFDLDNVAELESEATEVKPGRLAIDTCDGQWLKYKGNTVWVFNQEADE